MSRHASLKRIALAAVAAASLHPAPTQSASHREAPLTAIDRTADITDFYAFVSPDDPNTVTSILCTDPLLEPANGPNYFPFDPEVSYEILVDNDHDGDSDVGFEFRFQHEFRLPGVPVGFAGVGGGVSTPDNSPAPIPPGTPLIPPAITALDGPGSQGLGLRQSYEVWLHSGRAWAAARCSRCRATSGRARCPTTTRCTSRACSSSGGECACSRAPWTTPSSSTSVRPSTRSTSG
jgi:hypothetical protein